MTPCLMEWSVWVLWGDFILISGINALCNLTTEILTLLDKMQEDNTKIALTEQRHSGQVIRIIIISLLDIYLI